MELTEQQVSSQVHFVHMLTKSFMKNYNIRTTTFMKPGMDSPNGCVGLFGFGNKDFVLAVMPNGSIKEHKGLCPQMMVDLIERNFKNMLPVIRMKEDTFR